jgi:hypothetical protein
MSETYHGARAGEKDGKAGRHADGLLRGGVAHVNVPLVHPELLRACSITHVSHQSFVTALMAKQHEREERGEPVAHTPSTTTSV